MNGLLLLILRSASSIFGKSLGNSGSIATFIVDAVNYLIGLSISNLSYPPIIVADLVMD